MSTKKVKDIKDLSSPEYLKHIVLDFKQMKTFIEDPKRVIMTKADGVWYEDSNGKRYLDGISGIYVVTVGHNNPRIKKAIFDQLNQIEFSPPMHGTNPTAIKLAKLLSHITPGDLNTIKILSGGSEATEAAMKLARQYHRQTGNPNKYKIISQYEGFHGCTMGSLSSTGIKERKSMFEPLCPGFLFIFPPTCSRCPYEKEYPDCNTFCARIVEHVIKMEDPDSVAAIILEPIIQTGGIIVPPDEYLPIFREICDEHNVLLIFDEIITAFGRTGEMFASQTFNTIPDVMCMAKGMGSGYIPLSAIAFRDKIAYAFWGEEGIQFMEGHTYSAHPVASAVGIACIKEIQERNLCAHSKELGEYLKGKLEELKDKFEVIGDVRGKGLLIGIEFKIQNFGTKVGKIALDKGLLLRYDPTWIAFAPPLIIEKEEVDMIADIFKESVEEAMQD